MVKCQHSAQPTWLRTRDVLCRNYEGSCDFSRVDNLSVSLAYIPPLQHTEAMHVSIWRVHFQEHASPFWLHFINQVFVCTPANINHTGVCSLTCFCRCWSVRWFNHVFWSYNLWIDSVWKPHLNSPSEQAGGKKKTTTFWHLNIFLWLHYTSFYL